MTVISTAKRGWFSRADARATGYSEEQIRQRLRTGQWVRLARDAYVEPASWPADEQQWDHDQRLHLLRIRAALGRLGPTAVASHQSAAVLHGLPTWNLDLTKAQATKPAGRTRSDAAIEIHRGPIDPDEIVEVDGLRVVTPARAVAELACTSSYEVGVVLADAALHRGLATPDELVEMADRHHFWPGSPAARSAARFANGLSESVGESRLRVLAANHGLPSPQLQVKIFEADGRLIARVDALLADVLVVEFDGATKYGDGEAVVGEKWREDRLRARGYQVVRVGWADLDRPSVTARRLWQGLERASASGGSHTQRWA
ncbi:hypothetical protein GCM10029976_084910 [Kribbella albertanoniae]